MTKLTRISVALTLASLCLLMFTGCAGTILTGREYDITDYFPLGEGYWWLYWDSSTGQQWAAEVWPRESFAGQLAWPVDWHGAGYAEQNFYRSTVAGLSYLGWYVEGTGTTFVLDPPALMPNDMSELQPVTSYSTLYVNGIPVGSSNYTFEIRGEDRITVSAGTFSRCLQVRTTIAGTAQPLHVVTTWYLKDVGPIRISIGAEAHDLVNSNLLPP